ncbi:MAG: hypothetical protein H6797_01835 [Candidatus Nomurabacteria bacterium]|nr:MAG: hypothetical protein H6797_01835 [Candidatus Nomurabacteria bacterium]
MQTYRNIDDVFAATQRAIASKTTDKELAEYLNAFVQGRLTTGTPEAVPSYEVQRDRLVAVMKQLYADGFGYHQAVRGEIDGVPKFFEVILSMALVEHAVELVSVHYEKQEIAAGVSTVRKIPYAEFVATDEKLKEQLARHDESVTPTAATDIVAAAPPVIELGAEPHSITIRSYDADTGTLYFGGCEIVIIGQKNRRGKAAKEPTQGGAMRKLFKSVNTLRDGVLLRSITSVRADKFDARQRKLAKNHLNEINRKINEVTGVPKLIIYDEVKYYIDKSYLKSV